jgi:iron complex transport system substrate-binding protein
VKHALGETSWRRSPSASSSWTAASSTTYSRSASRRSGWRRRRSGGRPSYLAGKAQGIKTVGGISELNLEAIAALKPDLILGSKLRANDLYDKLSAIAPTVFSIRPGFPVEGELPAGRGLRSARRTRPPGS